MVLAQDGPSPFLPDWLADAPPWLQALAIVLAVVAALALVTASTWGPALAARISGSRPDRTSLPPGSTGSTAAPVGSPTTSAPATERYDAKMQIIDRLVTDLQDSQDRLEEEARGLRTSLADAATRETRLTAELATAKEQLLTAREEIGRLRWQIETMAQQRAPWQQPGSGGSPGS